jgi:hypothetical protein
MGILDIFSKSEETVHLVRLPSGSFTIDAEGELIASTLPCSFPEAQVREIGTKILQIFRNARKTEMPLTEIVVNFSALKITARELRGGAIIFLAPDNPN